MNKIIVIIIRILFIAIIIITTITCLITEEADLKRVE